MVFKNILIRFRSFLRQEYFDPDVLRALLVTLGLVVPLVISYAFNVPAYGSFAAITSQLLLGAKIQTTYLQKAFILATSLIFISLAPFIGTLVGGNMWWAIVTMALIAGISSLAKEIGAHGQALSLCAVILFLLSLNGPHNIETGLFRMIATWCGGVWASMVILFFWPIRPDLPYYTNLALPWELSGNLAALLANDTSKELEDKVQKKEIVLRNAINNVLPFLRKKKRRLFYIRRDLLKTVRASSRFGATLVAMFANLETIRRQKPNGPWLTDLQTCLNYACQASKAVANLLVLNRNKDFAHLENCVTQFVQATQQLEQHLNTNDLDIAVRLDLHRILILFQSAIHYLQDAQLLLNRIKEKKINFPNEFTSTPSQPVVKLVSIQRLFDFRKVPLRHTLRLMLLTALSVGLFFGFNIPRGYWIALTIMVVMQPDYGTTQQKALQRVTGTTIGAALSTLLLIHLLPTGYYILLIALFCFLFIYLQQRNYTVAVVFVTMLLVAMFEISGAIDWHYAAYRLFATSLGGILAILGAFLLWPDWERSQVRGIMAKGFIANRDLLLQLQHELVAQTGFHARIIADRRKAEIANITIADSVVRLQLEPGTKKQKLQIAQNISYQNKRLTRELTSFAALLPSIDTNEFFPEVILVLQNYAQLLTHYADSIKTEIPFTDTIPRELPFPDIKSVLQPSLIDISTKVKKQLHLDTGMFKAELIHEQINKVALIIQELGQAVQALNLL
ncbi:FUSC family protein [Adhaeribacter radiodurans]|uniref:FUSC family protein n=1 Tax=Adhaeribacter radiodurans TaxID=2745197 RepID=A0A7L7L2A8_9BACT|nr:FUSC family protein [Adhaeribacter radiodurans]QMU26893.1 FUSC family protein [Adhaeribacter radiodurans]